MFWGYDGAILSIIFYLDILHPPVTVYLQVTVHQWIWIRIRIRLIISTQGVTLSLNVIQLLPIQRYLYSIIIITSWFNAWIWTHLLILSFILIKLATCDQICSGFGPRSMLIQDLGVFIPLNDWLQARNVFDYKKVGVESEKNLDIIHIMT